MEDIHEFNDLILRFEKRARFKEFQAYIVLVIIFFLLGAGVFIFIYAPTITQTDLLAKHKSKISELKKQKKIINKRVILFNKNLDDLFFKWDKKNKQILSNYTTKEGDENFQAEDYITFASIIFMKTSDEHYIEAITNLPVDYAIGFRKDYSSENNNVLSTEYYRFKNKSARSNYINQLRKENGFPSNFVSTEFLAQGKKDTDFKNSINEKINQLRTQLVLVDNDKIANATAPKKALDKAYLNMIHTNFTRFGTLLIIVFLVGILIPLYRYNIRLSSYYHARADVILLLSKGITEKIDILATILTPNYDFGKIPNNMLEQTIELAREMTKLVKTK